MAQAQRPGIHLFGHRFSSSRKACLITILLLMSCVEPDPGPVNRRISIGLVNAWSIVNKTALSHDAIADNKLDLLAVIETFVYEDSPDIYKTKEAPDGYFMIHQHRFHVMGKAFQGMRVAIIH